MKAATNADKDRRGRIILLVWSLPGSVAGLGAVDWPGMPPQRCSAHTANTPPARSRVQVHCDTATRVSPGCLSHQQTVRGLDALSPCARCHEGG